MKKKIIDTSSTVVGFIVILWLVPIMILGGVLYSPFFIYNLFARKKKRRTRIDLYKSIRAKGTIAYLNYDRNNSFSKWIEEEFLEKYKDVIYSKKFYDLQQKELFSVDVFYDMNEDAEHGGDNYYTDVAEENDDIATLFIFSEDGTVTRWTPPMLDEKSVDMKKAKKLYKKLIDSEL